MDLRPGGICEFVMVSDADGAEYRNAGTFVEVVEPERLVLRDSDVDLLVTVTLREVADGTEMTIQAVGEYGGDAGAAGWSSTLDRLLEALP
jgi:uncharacterized protein YndB with AHSA1/START domain